MPEIYSLAEIAAALRVPRGTVASWHSRGKLPSPTAVLKAGPVWLKAAIEPWIEERKKSVADKGEG